MSEAVHPECLDNIYKLSWEPLHLTTSQTLSRQSNNHQQANNPSLINMKPHWTQTLLFISPLIANAAPTSQLAYHDYGELRVAVTSQYEWLFNSRRSAGPKITLSHPKPDEVFRPLGPVGVGQELDSVNDRQGTLVVGLNPDQPPADASMPALKEPVEWKEIWRNDGSSAVFYVSIWRPVAPEGYTCLGDTVSKLNYWVNDKQPIWCVRNDFVKPAVYNATALWKNQDTGAKERVSLWETVPSKRGDVGDEFFPLYTGTFHAETSWEAPVPNAKILAIKIPRNYTTEFPNPPQIKQGNYNGVNEGDVLESTGVANLTLPLTSLFPPNHLAIIQNIRTPFCTLQKTVGWLVRIAYRNKGTTVDSIVRTMELGVSKEETRTMEEQVGLSITAQAGFEASFFQVSLNYQLTRGRSSTLASYKQQSSSTNMNVSPGTAGVLLTKRETIKGVLENGNVVHETKIDFEQNIDRQEVNFCDC